MEQHLTLIFKRMVCEYIEKRVWAYINIFSRIKYIDTVLLAKCYENKYNKYSQAYLCTKHDIVNESEHGALGCKSP